MTLGEDDSVLFQRCEQKPSLQETRGVSALLRGSVRSQLCVEGLPPLPEGWMYIMGTETKEALRGEFRPIKQLEEE